MLQWVTPDSIQVAPERQRKEFNAKSLGELAESISRLGLIHPLVVEARDDGLTLIAGERRLRACKLILSENLPIVCGTEARSGIPVIERRDLDEIMLAELELEENIQREDLSWQERSLALAKLYDLRHKLNGSQTLAETAEEARVSRGTVSSAILVAPHLSDPEVSKAKDLREAEKILQRRAEAEHRAKLALKFDVEKTPHRLMRSEAVDFLHSLPSNSIDILLTDPPYGIGANKFGDQSKLRHEYIDDEHYARHLLTNLASQIDRIAKPEAFLYIFIGGFQWFTFLEGKLLFDWQVWPRPLVWNKMGNGMLAVPDKGPRYTYELILFAYRGQRRVVKQGAPDVLSHPPVHTLLHPAQKPVSLYVDLLSRIALPNDRVLDPFVGSGTIFPAANKLRLVATGCEDDEDSYNLALSRIEEKGDVNEQDHAPDLVI